MSRVNFWMPGSAAMSDTVGLYVLGDAILRALGLMLIGVALYRIGIIQGRHANSVYRAMGLIGLLIGLPMALLGGYAHASRPSAVWR